MISRLHYITQESSNKSHAQMAQEACLAGVDWIQLRVKEKSYSEILSIATELKEICKQFNARLIINDYVSIAKEIDADGLHLGKTDTSVAEARKLVGNNIIIGGTANTFEDIVEHVTNGVDYIGLGPFRFTETKKNLSPILGLEGYSAILTKCKENNITIPILAIGGITADDIEVLMKTGIHGIAISSLVSNALNKREVVSNLLSLINK
ncbi:MAG: thiamine phosphate synthase [Bacteroidetes bacterium]|nr:thiamine phosphate synthase [Bacteroidota bacterium]